MAIEASTGNNLLHIAAELGHDEICSAICDSNPELLKQKEKIDGNTPLHVACAFNKLEVTKVFCELIECEA